MDANVKNSYRFCGGVGSVMELSMKFPWMQIRDKLLEQTGLTATKNNKSWTIIKEREWLRSSAEVSRDVRGGVVLPQVHVFEAVDGEYWQVLGGFSQVVQRVSKLGAIGGQKVDAA